MTSIVTTFRRGVLAAALLLGATAAAEAQGTVTIQSLIDQGFTVVQGFFNPNAGAVLFLQDGNKLFMCVATEGPESLTTAYCKPVG